VVQHRRGADLHRAAAQEEVIEGVSELRDAADAREALLGKARVISDILARDRGRIAGPPRPPLDTRPSTFISNSRDSASMRGREGKVFDELTASAPPRKTAPASSAMSPVAG